jgi:P-type conjugative transfer protein TrbG
VRSMSSRTRLVRGTATLAFRNAALTIAAPLTVASAQAPDSTARDAARSVQERVQLASSNTETSTAPPLTARVAVRRWEARAIVTGLSAVGAVTVVPFDGTEKVLTCSVLRACIVELEPGEVLVNEPVAGDLARWIIMHARAGPAGANALVVVKPKACGVTTNLVLSTDRRIYDLDLESPPCSAYTGSPTNPKREYVRHVRFSYPAESTLATKHPTRAIVADSAEHDSLATSARRLNREYAVVRTRRGWFGMFGEEPLDFPWVPTAIGDDGAHVYITLPPEARQHAAPVLYAVETDGSRTLVNYTMRDTVVVTDRTFRRGLFVIAAGEREQRLEFENLAWSVGPDQVGREP